MEENYETFEEELWPPRADPSPPKPVRQIRRPEMYTSRKFREEVAPAPHQPKSEPKILHRDPSVSKPKPLQKSLSTQNLTQIETPWENVTLNRCLLVAITIVVLASGFQRLHEAFRSHGKTEVEEAGLIMRRSGMFHHQRRHSEPETSLWEVVFWWLPDLDDEEEDEDIKRRKLKSGRTAQASRGLRNRPLPDKKLLKQRDGKLKDRRAKKARVKKIKAETGRGKMEEHEEAAEDERDEDTAAKKKILEAKRRERTKG